MVEMEEGILFIWQSHWNFDKGDEVIVAACGAKGQRHVLHTGFKWRE